MKLCPTCQQWRENAEFSKDRARKDGLQSQCKTCRKEVDRQIYLNRTPEKHQAIKQREQQREIENARRVYEYLLTHPCVDCGESDPGVLEFDHVNGQKVSEVSVMIYDGYSWETIAAEIAKCEVRCANCHLIATSERRGARRADWMQVA